MFQKKKKSNHSLFKALGVIIVMALSAVGINFVPKMVEKSVPVHVATASKLELDVAKALSGKSRADHETLYKVFEGVSEYVKNAPAIRNTVELYKAVDEVQIVYDINHKFPEIAPIVRAHLNKDLEDGAKIADKKDIIIQKFDELAQAVRYSALQNKEK